MDQLSSCYFCGGALDVSLSEYPVVPTELRAEGEGSKTVVLCTTCRQKLANVVEEVVAATGAGAGGDGFEPLETETADDGGFEPISSVEDSTADDSDSDDHSDDSTSLLSGVSSAQKRSTTDETASADGTETTSADETTPTPETTSTDAGGQSDGGPSLTRLEYNKVMRLLKNREFPVDRGEIRDVATSAYQISPEEFDAVIDAAIERGLIAERDGQFISPDEGRQR